MSTCAETLALIQADPLELPAAAVAHTRICPACAEARVAWLAQEQPGPALAPAGYFERLPDRVLAKLPPARRSWRPGLRLGSLAAGLFLAIGLGGFWLGRSPGPALTEAALPSLAEAAEALPETPFQTGDDDLAQLPALNPDEAQAILERLAPGGRP
jgi:hypothetical protein